MTAYRAAWVVPIDQPPVRDGVVAVEAGRIVSVGRDTPDGTGTVDLGEVALLPGLVNAHTHIELSWLKDRVPPANRFTDWVKALIAIRRGTEQVLTPAIEASIHGAIRELRASGTVAVGDITNSLGAVAPMRAAGLKGIVFHELLGFAERDGTLVDRALARRAFAGEGDLAVSLAPHAPYSTSLELFRAIRRSVDESTCGFMSVHLGESPEEVELLSTGGGAWRGMLQAIGAWRDDWEIPRCGPVDFLDRHGILNARTLVVHGVQFDAAALARLREIGATLVTCPRSNRWVGVGYPPIDRFYESGVAVAVGTDSLASVENLNLFDELKTMRWLAPGVPARSLLESATLVGARALGLGDELGTLTQGKAAAIIAVRLPAPLQDVEEYLVSGVQPAQISWVN